MKRSMLLYNHKRGEQKKERKGKNNDDDDDGRTRWTRSSRDG